MDAQNSLLAGIGAILLGLAVANWRRGSPELADLSDTAGMDYAAWAEPDQSPSIMESAVIMADPSNWLPSAPVAPDLAATNAAAFLRMIRYSEGTDGEDGYRTLFGGALFDSYAQHPRIYVPFRSTSSSAAGAYQILYRTWVALRDKLGLPDFSPASQDAAALELIRERGALPDVYAGRVQSAIRKVAKVWASLPGASYNQPERKISQLMAAYQQAGGYSTESA